MQLSNDSNATESDSCASHMMSSYVTSSNVTKTFIRMVGPIETEEVPFDAPNVQKDDGANCRAIGATCNVPTLAKINQPKLEAKLMDGYDSNFWVYIYNRHVSVLGVETVMPV